jgi:hypothetical protein
MQQTLRTTVTTAMQTLSLLKLTVSEEKDKGEFESLTMPIRLDTVLRKVKQMPNKVNSDLLKEFYQHMKDNGTS